MHVCCVDWLQNGTDDKTFHALFKPIMSKVMEVFRPGAIVMQCGECCSTLSDGIMVWLLLSGCCPHNSHRSMHWHVGERAILPLLS